MIKRTLGRSALLLVFAVCLAIRPGGAVTRPKLESFLAAKARGLIEEYLALCSIPNIASDQVRIGLNARAVAALFERRGVAMRLLEGRDGTPPLVFGEIVRPGARKTVIFYAHYDGQPVDPAQWTTDPWRPILRDGRLEDGGTIVALEGYDPSRGADHRLYGRSVSDDKAPIMALAAALDLLRQDKSAPSINVKFLFEGEEEAGSPHLRALLLEHKDILKADGLFICDGPVDQSGRMQVTFGARGSMGLELTVYGPNHALHSGHYGNWAPNPAALLAGLLASMRNGDGEILIAGYYDKVRPVSAEDRRAIAELPDIDARLREEYGLGWTEADNARLAERILRPALNIRGIRSGAVGDQAANAVPPAAQASFDLRLVPDQDPGEVKALVEAHIAGRGFHILRHDPTPGERLALTKIIKVEWEEGYPAYRLPLDDPFGRAVMETLSASRREAPLRLPALGGSVPMRMFAEAFGVPVLGLPIVNHDNNQHGPDENLRLGNLWEGIGLFAALLSGIGPSW